LGYKSYKDKVLKILKENKHEFCEKVGVLAVAESQSLTAVLTGNLKRSIVSEVMENDKGIYIGVTEDAPYGVIVEKGSSKQVAQPYLEPGCNNAIPKITKVAEALYRSKLGGN
jgi:HK97 gp10 family phage protein